VPCVVNKSGLQEVDSIPMFLLMSNINTLYIDKFVVQKTSALSLVPCVCVIDCVITGLEPQLSS
jgi:hypothetical protein